MRSGWLCVFLAGALLCSTSVVACGGARGSNVILGTTIGMDEVEPSYPNRSLEIELVDETVYTFEPPVQTIVSRTTFSAMGASNEVFDMPREEIVAVRLSGLGGSSDGGDDAGDVLLLTLGIVLLTGLVVAAGFAVAEL